ncbi:hypothetical protein QWZ10_02295 [Paracoccus cavernae]|uniref:ROK family protein n=1 Tax=Paracoccus cavernae TaxID=1571207 RepID=A0ABT8D382_9RHOB|nr:hypothetical protein [Paracoccus cavernae]
MALAVDLGGEALRLHHEVAARESRRLAEGRGRGGEQEGGIGFLPHGGARM